MEENKFAAAEPLLKRSMGKAPGSEPAYTALAGLYLKFGREAEALAVYETLLRLDPYHLEALNNSGIINAKNGRYGAAGKLFKRALEMAPGDKSAAMNLERVKLLEKTAG